MKDLDGFRFDLSPVNEALVRSLHAGAFLAERRNAVLVGGTGTGKTHLSVAIAAIAKRSHGVMSAKLTGVIRTGAWARFFTVVHLVNRLEAESRNATAGATANHLRRLGLMVLNELGCLPFPRSGGELLLHLLARLHGQASVIVTTNLEACRVFVAVSALGRRVAVASSGPFARPGLSDRDDQPRLRRLAASLRRRPDNLSVARPPYPPSRHRRDRKPELQAQNTVVTRLEKGSQLHANRGSHLETD